MISHLKQKFIYLPKHVKIMILIFVISFGVIGSMVTLLIHAATSKGNTFKPQAGTINGDDRAGSSKNMSNAVTSKDNSTSASGASASKPDSGKQSVGVAVGSGASASESQSPARTTQPDIGTDITTYGAIGDGATDDTAALNRAFSTAPTGSTLILPAGKTFKHTASLFVTVADLHLTGTGTLLATNQLDSALQIRAADFVIDGGLTLKFTMPGATRQSAGWRTMLFIDGVSGATIKNITVDGSPSAGIMMYGATNFTIDTVTVKDTLADGIHSTFGSHGGVIKNVTVRNPADDGVSVVSYLADGAQTYDIQVSNAKVYGGPWGRGFTVVGGHNITFTDVYVESTAQAGIYVAAEGNPWYTYGVSNVTFRRATLVDVNTHTATDHGAIFVYNNQAGQSIGTVDIEDVTVTNTNPAVSRQIGYFNISGGGITGVQLRNITVTGGPSTLFANNISSSEYNNISWIFNGVPITDHVGFTPYP